MSGHSKWATIKRKKGAADAKRGQTFTKFAREIQLAARQGADPNFNFRLRLIIDKAKAENMPKENIDRAIKRGAGLDTEGGQLEEVTYEGYGPHGVALYVQTVTDNKNRTVSELRRALTRGGGALGESGSVAWLFEQKGLMTVAMGPKDQDKIFEMALEAGAEDVQYGDGVAEIYTMPSDLQSVRQAFLDAKQKVEDAEVVMQAKTQVSLSPSETLQVLNLIEAIEDLDDVVKVDSNLEITEEALEQLG
jgi:YebC/PmpR family DNA-binding regulatory protein